MINLPLKYIGYTIVFQEVPNEISLAINISGCPVRCQGCHSKYLWNYIGNYLENDINNLITKYLGHITCVCFMGGNQNINELKKLCKICHDYNLKTCLYTGFSLSQDLIQFAYQYLDYIKVGKYEEKLGGLNDPNTNQRMYRVCDNSLEDITNEFWRKYE